MRLREALQAIPRRRHNRTIVLVFLAAVLFGILGVALGQILHALEPTAPISSLPVPVQVLYLLVTAGLSYFVSPLPWQWTGDDRPMAPFVRGLFQTTALVLLEQGLTFFYLQALPLPAQVPFKGPAVAVFSFAAIAFIGFVIASWESRESRRSAAKAKAREAQWTLLQSQMSPHALLNALNGLAQLVREDLEAGRTGIRDLAETYRQLLDHGGARSVTLGQERNLICRFLGVEQLRLGSRLRVEWDWDSALDEVVLPPLLLQPLVENAVKHGVAPSETGGDLRISVRREGRDLRLTVSNTGLPLGASPSSGTSLGLRNLKARLQMAFGDRAHFELKTAEAGTVSEIRLKGGRS